MIINDPARLRKRLAENDKFFPESLKKKYGYSGTIPPAFRPFAENIRFFRTFRPGFVRLGIFRPGAPGE